MTSWRPCAAPVDRRQPPLSMLIRKPSLYITLRYGWRHAR